MLGLQPDGTYGAVQVGGVVPVLPPADPTVLTSINGLTVFWSGLMADTSAPTADFAAIQVHCSLVPGFTPDGTTLQGHMIGAGAFAIRNLTPGATYYIVTQAMNGAGNLGPASNQVSGVPVSVPASIPAGSLQQAQLGFTISAGGVSVTFAAVAPVSPNVNDLWFNSSAGNQLNQWNGTAWTAYQWGTGTLAAGAVTTGVILAGTIAAGIVDGTTLTGSTIQNSTTNPKTSINPDGSITITNAAGVAVFKIGPDGTIFWFSSTGNLLMSLAPGGTQLIYASLTGPYNPDNEPVQPALLFAVTSTASVAAVATATGAAVAAGVVVTVVASMNSATGIATGVADSKGNTYTLLQSQSSVTPTQQVFQSVIATPLIATDTISVTYSVTSTLGKNVIATATTGMQAVPLDYSAQATGTSTAPSVAGTPTAYADTVMMIITNNGTAGPSAVPDGWQLTGQTSAAGTQTTSVYYSVNLASSGALTASATLPSSLTWVAVTLGYIASPVQSFAAFAPVISNASISASTQWADNGNFSARITKVGAAASWGVTYPAFPVQGGGAYAMRVVLGTLNIALAALQTGMTFWSGPNGTGSNLGRWYVTWGTLGLSGYFPLTMYNCYAPANAVSATIDVTENQADTAGNWFLIDGVHVPGGLAYSNSPVATSDALGNQVPQGISFNGLPGVTNVFSVLDAYLGRQIASIDGYGNITGQQISANTDVQLAGASLLNDILPNYSQGIVTRGWCSAAGNWPSTPIGNSETPVLELDFVVPAGREYIIQVMQATFIPTVAANTQMIQRFKYTTDGSTPTTSSAQVAGHSPGVQGVVVANSGQNMPTPYMEWVLPIPAVETTYRMLLTAAISSGSFQYALGSETLEMRVTDMGNNSPVNNGVMLGTGTSGSTGAQNYTEYFYGNTTWSYWEYGMRNHNGSLYQGAYSGEGYAQYAFIQFSQGSRGNNLNTVLNYTVQKVTMRLLNQHSWYNSGMTVSLHSSQSAGSNIGAISSELQNWHINEGQMLTTALTSGAWAPFKAGGTTYAVLRPVGGSTSLDYYGYFWGGGNNNANVPMLTVQYTH